MAIKQLEFIKNEVQEVVFTNTNFCDSEDYYLTLINGDITPLLQIGQLYHEKPYDFTIFTPYIPNTVKRFFVNGNTYQSGSKVKTLNDITPNLSKCIPGDNAVLFLSGENCEKYMQCFQGHYIGLYADDGLDKVTLKESIDAINEFVKNPIRKKTIFLHHGTQSELQKANEVAKELKEKYGVEEVNLFILHYFEREIYELKQNKNGSYTSVRKFNYINKIITTNSTGILPVQNTERLQVIDCKEIFEEYLKENN